MLLDFWAVWCGPCVASFPHLKEWNAEYKDKGLEIIGVTTYFEQVGFEKGKLVKAKEKMTTGQEQDMLKDFSAHHKLPYRLMALPKDEAKEFFKEYKVAGIPQVVLIDRKGIVRFVKVGAGEDAAKAIGGKIKELIAEK